MHYSQEVDRFIQTFLLNIYRITWFLYFFHLIISVTAILRKLKQQSRESVEDKRPKLLKALREVRTALWCFSLTTVGYNLCFQLLMTAHCHFLFYFELFFDAFRLLCSLETFIWSCTGTFKAGVSFHTSHRIYYLSFWEGLLPAQIDSFSSFFHISAFVVQDASIRRL